MTTQSYPVRSLAALTLSICALSLGACDVKKTQEGEAPSVKVEGGQLPKYDVDAPEVKVEQKEKTIKVPDVDIVTPKEKREGGNVEASETAPAAATPPAATTPPAQ